MLNQFIFKIRTHNIIVYTIITDDKINNKKKTLPCRLKEGFSVLICNLIFIHSTKLQIFETNIGF